MHVRLWYHCNRDFHSTITSWLFRASPSAQHWPLTALLRGVILLDFIWQGLRAESETALPEREKNLNFADRPKDSFAFSDQGSFSNCLPRCRHPLGSSCHCFSESIPAPSHQILLMPELSNQLCSSCQHGSALLQIARVCPATWETPQRAAKAWFLLGITWFCCFWFLCTESSGTCQPQGWWRIWQGSGNSKAGVSEEGRWRSALLPEQNQNHLILPKHRVLFFWRLNEK